MNSPNSDRDSANKVGRLFGSIGLTIFTMKFFASPLTRQVLELSDGSLTEQTALVSTGAGILLLSYVLIVVLGKLGLDRVARGSGPRGIQPAQTPTGSNSIPATYTTLLGVALFFLGILSVLLSGMSAAMFAIVVVVIAARRRANR